MTLFIIVSFNPVYLYYYALAALTVVRIAVEVKKLCR